MRNRRLWFPSALFGLLTLLYGLVPHSLYEFDGITYLLYGKSPVENVNPHHVLWVIVQWILRGINAHVLGSGSVVLFQMFGIVLSAAALTVFYQVLVDLGAEAWLAFCIVLFLAFSPPFLLLSSQNLPYPLYFFFAVLYLYAFVRKPVDGPRLWLALASIVAATLFHQMAVLLIPAGCLALRSKRGILWGGTALFLIGIVYAVLGWMSGHHTLHDYLFWGTEYMHEIHPMRLSVPEFFPQSVIGNLRCFVQLKNLEDSMLGRLSPTGILWRYAAFGAGLLMTAGWLALPIPRTRLKALSENPIVILSLTWIGIVSFFALLWEPTNFNFWAINMFPIFILLVLFLAPAKTLWKVALAVVLLIIGVMNLRANQAIQFARARLNPLHDVQIIAEHVRDKDILISFNRGDTGGVNYDLMFTCLEISSQSQGRALLEDFVIPHESSGSWQHELSGEIHDVMDDGGDVYLSNGVLDPASYQSRSRPNPFSPFVRDGYAQMPWNALSQDVFAFFKAYELAPSFKVGSDVVWRLKPAKV